MDALKVRGFPALQAASEREKFERASSAHHKQVEREVDPFGDPCFGFMRPFILMDSFSFYLGLPEAKKLSQIWQHISTNVYNVDFKKHILSLFNFDVLEIVGRSN